MAIYKNIIKAAGIISLGFTLGACSSTGENTQTTAHNEHHQMGQYHVGSITPKQLLAQYDIFADAKSSDQTKISELEVLDLANQLNNRKMVVVFGTWCHDSQREVPRLLNLLELVRKRHPEVKFDVEFIAAAPFQFRDKNLVKQYEITAVPTIMLFDNEQEMGRVVETTKLSLSADIVNMKL